MQRSDSKGEGKVKEVKKKNGSNKRLRESGSE